MVRFADLVGKSVGITGTDGEVRSMSTCVQVVGVVAVAGVARVGSIVSGSTVVAAGKLSGVTSEVVSVVVRDGDNGLVDCSVVVVTGGPGSGFEVPVSVSTPSSVLGGCVAGCILPTGDGSLVGSPTEISDEGGVSSVEEGDSPLPSSGISEGLIVGKSILSV